VILAFSFNSEKWTISALVYLL